MSVLTTSLAAVGASAAMAIPMSRINWSGLGASALVNFTGQGSNGAAGSGTPASGTATVQISNDPNANPNATAAQQATARWNDHSCLTAVTTDANDVIDLPVAFVRLILTAYGAGTVTLQIGLPDDSNPANP